MQAAEAKELPTQFDRRAQALRLATETAEDRIAYHARAIVGEVGEDVRRPGLVDTPKRYAAAMRFVTEGYETTLAEVIGSGVFAAEGDGVVVVRDIEFFSLCEHHLLPFFGRAHVAYLPSDKIIGLSKIPRIVDLYARRFQVQERITEQVADALVEVLEPRGVMVIVEARHMCMAMRGVQKQHSVTSTRALRGACAHDAQVREDVLAMVRSAIPASPL